MILNPKFKKCKHCKKKTYTEFLVAGYCPNCYEDGVEKDAEMEEARLKEMGAIEYD